jgi:hypothetical protein
MDSKSITVKYLYEDGTIIEVPRRKKKFVDDTLKAELKKRGSIKKDFAMYNPIKRKIKCSAIRLFRTKKNSIKWFTLTFPEAISQKEANKCFSKFIDNCKKNYNLNEYVTVKENTKNGRPHFHCLFDIPFIKFNVLNNVWNNTFTDVMPYSINALSTGKEKIIFNIQGLVSYITKYITKSSIDEENNVLLYETKNYFISHNVISKPIEINYNCYVYLTTKFESKTWEMDYCKFIFLENFAFLPERIAFNIEKKQKKPGKIPIIPDAIQPNLSF